jgi:hypothetical protein
MYGATKQDWHLFSNVYGLTTDLLPVVSNPGAQVSPNSKLSMLGKVPSIYNREKLVAGLAGWTKKQSTANEVAGWARVPDYGICIQTRYLRAFDIDVEDADTARELENLIAAVLVDHALPVRYREGSAKRLIGVLCPGEMNKRIFKFSGGIVEFLANGQQFVAAGQHPSGGRYYWDGLQDKLPLVTSAELDEVFEVLGRRFNTSVQIASRQRLEHLDDCKGKDADLIDHLYKHEHVLSNAHDGTLYLSCPFKEEHSSEGNETATAYFPAGLNGYAQGHFKCFHAHCSHRTDTDFLHAIGYTTEGFSVVEDTPWPVFSRDKTGAIEPVLNNVLAALNHEGFLGLKLQYDAFLDEIIVSPQNTTERPLKDSDYVLLRSLLESKGFKSVSFELVRNACSFVAERNVYDSAIAWLKSLKWDKKPRVATFLRDHLQVEDSDYARAVGLYMWTTMAGRVLSPGVKADMVPVMVSEQGKRKTTLIEALVPDPEFACGIRLTDKDDDTSRKLRGVLVAEIAELRGLNTRDIESIRDFISQRFERWVPKYKERAVRYPRRCIFIGTTNDRRFLADPAGNRRWLPFEVGHIDIEAITDARDQLWAEAAHLFKLNGVMWQQAEVLAREVHDQFMVEHHWQPSVERFLASVEGEAVSTVDVVQGALGLPTERIHRGHVKDISDIMHRLGYSQRQARIGEGRAYVWIRSTDQDFLIPAQPKEAF